MPAPMTTTSKCSSASHDGRCSTSSTPWKIQSSSRAWRSWSPYRIGHMPFQRSCRKCSSAPLACAPVSPLERRAGSRSRGRCRTRPGTGPCRAAGSRRMSSRFVRAARGAWPPRAGCAAISSHSQMSCSSAQRPPRAAQPRRRARRARRPRSRAAARRRCVHGARLAELRADRVDDVLGHQPVGRELAAGDRHEAARRRRARAWSSSACARLTSRVSVSAALRVLEQRPHAGPHAQRARLAEAGHEPLAVVEHLRRPRPGVTVWSSGSSVWTSVVPITLTVRIGTRMSPSVGIWQRLITVFTSRWFIAIMIPRPGRTRTPSMPAISAICAGPRAGGVDRDARLDVDLLAGALVAQARARDRVAVAVDGRSTAW